MPSLAVLPFVSFHSEKFIKPSFTEITPSQRCLSKPCKKHRPGEFQTCPDRWLPVSKPKRFQRAVLTSVKTAVDYVGPAHVVACLSSSTISFEPHLSVGLDYQQDALLPRVLNSETHFQNPAFKLTPVGAASYDD
jgi:hypothetical protein